jgi:hypothetical protein
MNFTYLELATLKYAASKLLECVHQIEAVNITTGGNTVLVPQEYLDSLLDEVDAASKTIMQVTAINGDEYDETKRVSVDCNSNRD